MKIWIDITNTPHVSVLLPIIRHLEKNHELIITARNFSETIPLLEMANIRPIVIGGYGGKSRVAKFLVNGLRIFNTWLRTPPFDLSLSLGGNFVASVSWLRGKPSVVFSDNDISYKAPAYKYGNYFIFPEYFNTKSIEDKYGIKKEQIFKFDGFKEDIYIANYEPDPNFMESIPFDEYITIRPENLKASYVPKNCVTIVPELFKEFKDENILFMPRYPEEHAYAQGYNNIFIPVGPLKGLDVVRNTKAMLTGAGTFAREAALLGKTSVSFFPGKSFLAVDIIMQEKGWEFHSRSAKEIRQYLNTAEKRTSQQGRSKDVLKEVIEIIENIIKKESK